MQSNQINTDSKNRQIDALTKKNLEKNHVKSDRMFAVLMVIQWVVAVVLSFAVSPLTWIGAESSVHTHVYAAIIFGGVLAGSTVFLALANPGKMLTRHVIAVNQMLMCSLLIHLTGGRVTTHFYIFVSLAFLSVYRDWAVLLTATVITAGDHVLRGVVYPQSIFGITTVNIWVIVEHAMYVVFEDVILFIASIRGVAEVRDNATKQVEVEMNKTVLEERQEAIEKFGREAEENQKYLTESVEKILKEMSKFSNGDLRVKVEKERDDVIGELFDGFNRAVANTSKLLQEVTNSAQSAAYASTQISVSTQSIAATAEEQSAQSLEITSEAEEMNRAGSKSEEFIRLTLETANQNGEAAKDGQNVVGKTLEKIETLTETVKSSTTSVENLSQSSEEIGKILKVINDIANQTNLLALNAAIEAARAGVHGESFSVVASQVRALAGDTRDATQQISSIIETIQTEIKAAVQSMRLSFKEVNEGLELTNKTNEALSRINDESAKLLQRVHQMAEISEKQNMSSANVAQGVSEIADASAITAQNITEIASSTSKLNEVTDTLRELTSQFKFDSDEKGDNNYVYAPKNRIEHQNARAF